MPETNPLLDELDARGLLHDSTDRAALVALLNTERVTLYSGYDPTADSLHVGHLQGLVTLRRFLDAGHRLLVLVGGATGMIGDPSGRSDERNLLDDETVAGNARAIAAQVERVLGGVEGWELVDNATWTAGIGLVDFLRDVGKHITVNQMVARESVQS
ncbi:MAG: tyrosine--tRNA ligase, partial [Actinobacteria bacterium]|nr:tyrosine--tRNA ligase [Actinomycetota bacterium]